MEQIAASMVEFGWTNPVLVDEQGGSTAGAWRRRRALVLSDNGDHPMSRLSDTQLVILSAAAQRDHLSVLPLPETLSLKGGALNKVMNSLRNRGLIRVLGGDGGPERVVITSEAMAAVDVEADHDEAATAADTAPTSADPAKNEIAGYGV